jgi:hypothetical protein
MIQISIDRVVTQELLIEFEEADLAALAQKCGYTRNPGERTEDFIDRVNGSSTEFMDLLIKSAEVIDEDLDDTVSEVTDDDEEE